MQKPTDSEGSASYNELVEIVRKMLVRNFVPRSENNVGLHDPYARRARNIVLVLLSRMDIEIANTEEKIMGKKSPLRFERDREQIGYIEDNGDGSVDVTITDSVVKEHMKNNPDYDMMNIKVGREQLPETD